MKQILRIAVATLALASFAATAQAEGDAEKGKKIFKKKCKTCHMIGPKAKKRVGPALNNIIDAKAGSQKGFKYSKAMTKAGEDGLTWSVETLDKYLKKPKDVVPGTRMKIPGGGVGVSKDPKVQEKIKDDRKHVIAYLKKFSEMEKMEKKQ